MLGIMFMLVFNNFEFDLFAAFQFIVIERRLRHGAVRMNVWTNASKWFGNKWMNLEEFYFSQTKDAGRWWKAVSLSKIVSVLGLNFQGQIFIILLFLNCFKMAKPKIGNVWMSTRIVNPFNFIRMSNVVYLHIHCQTIIFLLLLKSE